MMMIRASNKLMKSQNLVSRGYCSQTNSAGGLFKKLFPTKGELMNPFESEIRSDSDTSFLKEINNLQDNVSMFGSQQKRSMKSRHSDELVQQQLTMYPSTFTPPASVPSQQTEQQLAPLFKYDSKKKDILDLYALTYQECKLGQMDETQDQHFLFIERVPETYNFESMKSLIQENVKECDIANFSYSRVKDSPLSGDAKSVFVTFSTPKDLQLRDPILKRFNLFGIYSKGERLKCIDPENLKTIKINRLDNDITENIFTDMIKDHWDGNMKDITVSIKGAPKSAHAIRQKNHKGFCYIEANSHQSAISIFQFLNKIHFRQPTEISWSRSIFQSSTLTESNLTTLTKSQSQKFGEIQLMKQIIDLKSKIKVLETKIEKSAAPKKSSKKINITN